MTSSNSGENIKFLIESILEEYKIKKPQITAAVSDRGPNCVLAVELSGFEHVPCFAHAVNTKMEEFNLITPNDISRLNAILLVMKPMENYVTTLGSATVTTASIVVYH